MSLDRAGHAKSDVDGGPIFDSKPRPRTAQEPLRRPIDSVGSNLGLGLNVTPIRPEFADPPLFEQAIAVVFDTLPRFSVGDFGLFWQMISDEFDACESHPVVQPHIERFDQTPSFAFQMQLVPAEALPRCFYRHGDRGSLVQVQSDRFGFNWLKHGDGAYPHSEKTFSRFFELFAKFQAFCSDRGFAPLTMRQCEITNVNIVPASAVGSAERATTFFSNAPDPDEPGFLKIESSNYTLQHLILDDAGSPIGRLYEVFAPALRTDTMEQAYRLELTARGEPLGAGVQGVEAFFSVARSALNAAFLAATTSHAQDLWGYKHGDRI